MSNFCLCDSCSHQYADYDKAKCWCGVSEKIGYGIVEKVVVSDDYNGVLSDLCPYEEYEERTWLDRVYRWAFDNMECCDEPEFTMLSKIVGAIEAYRKDIVEIDEAISEYRTNTNEK